MKYIVYTLRNPVNNEIFYVGRTSLKLMERLSAHLTQSKIYPQLNKSVAIANILKSKVKPVIEFLDEIEILDHNRPDRKRADDLENYWIEQLTAWGINLINEKFNPTIWSAEYKKRKFGSRITKTL